MTQQKQKAAKADDTQPDAVLEEVAQQKPKARKADDTQPEDAPRDQSTEPKQDQEKEPPPREKLSRTRKEETSKRRSIKGITKTRITIKSRRIPHHLSRVRTQVMAMGIKKRGRAAELVVEAAASRRQPPLNNNNKHNRNRKSKALQSQTFSSSKS